jgi:trehalose-6-phosphatase
MAIATANQAWERSFFCRLATADNGVLLLDYDQTIGLFSINQCVTSSCLSIPELLQAIMAQGRTRVILISELRVAEVVALLQMSPAPEIWGSRGLQRRSSSGDCEVLDIRAEAEEALAAVDLSLEAQGLSRVTEVQPGSITVRWSGLGRRVMEEVRDRASEAWLNASDHRWLLAREFEGGIEFRLRLWDKGDAVQQLLCELGSDVPVAYLGDEKSDEDAFRAMKDRGFCVLVRPKFIPTSADLWLQPGEVPRFLIEWLQASTSKAQHA